MAEPENPETGAYDARETERIAQAYWDEHRCFRAVRDDAREKFYCLSMFPYPSGQLHMGHVRNYTIGDVISRYQRMLGKNVLQPMGWDAFGLPAENAARDGGIAPQQWTANNIAQMKSQLKRLGYAYDWEREFATSEPHYYRWEQWFFTRLFDRGLAYRSESWVNWDPVDETVLANEQVIDGLGWRSGARVERRKIPQWFLRITDYADQLLDDLAQLDEWPERVRQMQRNWIGRSRGVEIRFDLDGAGAGNDALTVFTTRPDTLMGATYVALAAEHPALDSRLDADPALAEFVAECRRRPTAEAEMMTRPKRGVDTGLRAVHPLSGEALPVWCANFVLMEYGSGAVMSVPAHDRRDWEFARANGLPLRQVVRPADGAAVDLECGAFTDKGILCNSGHYDGMDFEAAFDAILADLKAAGRGGECIQYRLKDWGVSRQRYWGAPIPALYDNGECRMAGDDELPVELPAQPGSGVLPLAQLPGFRNAGAGAGGREVVRETDTFDTFFESSWYYVRFACAAGAAAIPDDEAAYWLPVDHYVGGIEHAVLHLLYARFFYKLMRDFGLVEGDEPFKRLLTQGMVLKDGAKMSKSRGNTVDPAAYIERYGADTVRLFMMFAAPPEQALEWSDSGVEGGHRFLKRFWRQVTAHCRMRSQPPPRARADAAACREMRRRIHATIAKVGDDYARRLSFNTAIAANMELGNALARFAAAAGDSAEGRRILTEGYESIVKMMAPVTPHIMHCLWRRLGHETPLVDCAWPQADERAMSAERCEIVVQVNGRLRSRLQLPAGSGRGAVEEQALADEKVRRFVHGREIVKTIHVENKLVNFVVR
ncbi:MAG: leucine--tRNA ligase [Gammaproteobacteria bacterium]|nr:leucine--tRNA ligase [Gammaproteobacteria bacterium]